MLGVYFIKKIVKSLCVLYEEWGVVLSQIVIGDETWFHHYEPKLKQDSMQ